MRLAAAHRLFQFEDRLIGPAGEPLQALAEEGFHALGDVVLVEELARLLRGPLDDVGEILDLLAHEHSREPSGAVRKRL